MTSKQLDASNWSIYFKAVLILGGMMLPMVITLQVWEVKQIHKIELHLKDVDTRVKTYIGDEPRYTPSIAHNDITTAISTAMLTINENYVSMREYAAIVENVEVIRKDIRDLEEKVSKEYVRRSDLPQ